MENIEKLLNKHGLNYVKINLKKSKGYLLYSNDTADDSLYNNECQEIRKEIFIVITIMKNLKTITHYMQQSL